MENLVLYVGASFAQPAAEAYDFYCTPDGAHSLYADEMVAVYQLLPRWNVSRCSTVDPCARGEGLWTINWKPPFVEQFGTATSFDENGRPFLRKKDADDCERRMLQAYFQNQFSG